MKKYELIARAQELINDAVEWNEEYYTNNEKNPIARYATWGFTEGDGLRYDELNESLQELISELLSNSFIYKEELDKFIAERCEVRHISNISRYDSKVYSVNIGEIHEDPNEELEEILSQLSKEEKDGLDYLFGDTICINMDYECWGLFVIDEEELEIEVLSVLMRYFL